MASGGSSDRTSSGPRSFIFGSDDVLCAYDDFTNQDPTSGRRSDPSSKDFLEENRIGRPLVGVYGQQDEYPKGEIIMAVEKCMKKYADNLLRHLEGISGRLSQLEIYCYKLERSIGEFRADMLRDQDEADSKLKSLEKHLQEVYRSIQILRDKQELAETQKELTKLQLAPKESTTPTQPQKSEEATRSSSVPEPKPHKDTADVPNPHLAVALTHQIPSPSSLPISNPPQPPPSYVLNQPVPFYPQQTQQVLQSEPQYIQPRPQQLQDPSIQAPPPQIVNHSQPPQPYPQYQHQQWPHSSSHQFPQPVVAPAQQSTPQPQPVRPHSAFGYSPIPQSGGSHTEAVPFGYGSPISTMSQPQQPAKVSGYSSTAVAPYPSQSNMQGYSTDYNIDGSRIQSYPPPPLTSTGGFHQHQMMRSHPYADMIEKAASMGYPREHVVGVVNRMAGSGQPVDFNALLDRLNSHAGAGGPPRAWSG